ncbi:MAG: aromatic ring-hydroxylating dioxygenase subunit alpha, partial [Gammaproteobacteria bacterium]|nr:aromatic ring-hydroxylating dioxygenase subunit alpha [Gammaproteobacteria bacterium]
MSTPSPVRRDPGYVGLQEAIATLPSSWYFDLEHHARELERIWY